MQRPIQTYFMTSYSFSDLHITPTTMENHQSFPNDKHNLNKIIRNAA